MIIYTIIVNRANYARLFPVLIAMQLDKEISNHLILTGTTILEEYGSFHRQKSIEQFSVIKRIEVEHGTRDIHGMAVTTASSVKKFSEFLTYNQPDMILLIGDRYETLGYAIAANYHNIKIAHLQGGELSGSVDENIRHCITKLSHLHFTATERSRDIVIQLGEKPSNVFNFGCPSGDYILNRQGHDKNRERDFIERKIGFCLERRYILVCYHPTTTMAIEQEHANIKNLISSLLSFGIDLIWSRPNSDAGSLLIEEELKSIKKESRSLQIIKLISNVSPQEYIELIDCADVCVGNSSSFIRDASFIGTPVVLTGNRQNRRELSSNVIHTDLSFDKLIKAIKHQLANNKRKPDQLYGEGNAATKIVSQIKSFKGSHIKDFNLL